MLNRNVIDNILENLLYVMPVLHKRLMRANPARISQNIRLSRLHVMIMGTMLRTRKMRASEIGREFMILKPQMTRLIKELVDAGLVEQLPDDKDKRAKYLVLTAQGKAALKTFRQLLKKSVAEQLSKLSDEELNEFSSLLTGLQSISSVLEKTWKMK
jgi:DNA-binding MarR family transcriptional regulator